MWRWSTPARCPSCGTLRLRCVPSSPSEKDVCVAGGPDVVGATPARGLHTPRLSSRPSCRAVLAAVPLPDPGIGAVVWSLPASSVWQFKLSRTRTTPPLLLDLVVDGKSPAPSRSGGYRDLVESSRRCRCAWFSQRRGRGVGTCLCSCHVLVCDLNVPGAPKDHVGLACSNKSRSRARQPRRPRSPRLTRVRGRRRHNVRLLRLPLAFNRPVCQSGRLAVREQHGVTRGYL